jgi:hypothetical protein
MNADKISNRGATGRNEKLNRDHQGIQNRFEVLGARRHTNRDEMQGHFSFSKAALNLGSEAVSVPFQKTVYRANRSCRKAACSATTLFQRYSYPCPSAFICVQAFSSCLRVSVVLGLRLLAERHLHVSGSALAKRYRAI